MFVFQLLSFCLTGAGRVTNKNVEQNQRTWVVKISLPYERPIVPNCRYNKDCQSVEEANDSTRNTIKI